MKLMLQQRENTVCVCIHTQPYVCMEGRWWGTWSDKGAPLYRKVTHSLVSHGKDCGSPLTGRGTTAGSWADKWNDLTSVAIRLREARMTGGQEALTCVSARNGGGWSRALAEETEHGLLRDWTGVEINRGVWDDSKVYRMSNREDAVTIYIDLGKILGGTG